MTFPTLRSSRSGNSASNVTSRGVQLPAGITAGDELVAIFVNDGSATVGWDNSTAGNWGAPVVDALEVNSAIRLSVFKKRAAGNESDLTLTVTTSAAECSSWFIGAYQNADTLDVAAAVTTQGTTVDPDPPSLTPPNGARDYLWLTAIGIDSRQYTHILGQDNPVSPTAPSGYAGMVFAQAFTDQGCGVAAATKSLHAATENPGAWHLNNNAGGAPRTISVTMALSLGGTTIKAPFFQNAQTFYSAAIVPVIQAARISSSVSFHDITIKQDKIIVAPFIAGAEEFFDAAIITAEIGVPFIPSAALFFDADVILGDAVLTVPFIASGATFYPVLVTGGDRVVPAFTTISVGASADCAMGDLAFYTGSAQGAAFQLRWETRGPIGFGDYTAFVAGEYEFDEACVWLRLEVEPVERVFAITRAKVNVDVPDVIDSADADVPEGGAWITFARNFYTVPKVVANFVSATGVDTVPRATIREDVERTRFFVTVHYGDDLTDSVAGRIHYVATGY